MQCNSLSSQSPDFLQKTIGIKDDVINQLLQELRMTQELHANLKKKYMAQDQKMREKVARLQQVVEEVRAENVVDGRRCQELQQQCDSQAQHLRMVTAERELERKNWEQKNQMLAAQNIRIKQQNQQLLRKYQESTAREQSLNSNITKLNQQIQNRDISLQQSREKYDLKQKQATALEQKLVNLSSSIEQKSQMRKRTALSDIQNKVKNILINI